MVPKKKTDVFQFWDPRKKVVYTESRDPSKTSKLGSPPQIKKKILGWTIESFSQQSIGVHLMPHTTIPVCRPLPPRAKMAVVDRYDM